MSEENYYFKLSEFADKLLQYYQKNPDLSVRKAAAMRSSPL